jgi:hypothetical protein
MIGENSSRSRGAGPLFRPSGDLIRAGQNCSVRCGYAIALNRILYTSPSDYAEEPIEVIYPTMEERPARNLYLAPNDSFEALDGLR